MDRILKSKYKVQDKIADSPSHVTYKGSMVDSDKGIVIKIYRKEYLDSFLVKQLKKDISILAKLSSPLIPRLIDGDYGWQGFYFVREFVEGQSLRETKLPLEPEAACDVASGICDAVIAAHGTGIVHGSLTPENIFICSSNRRIKVADFGIKKAVAEPVEQRAKWLMDASSAYSAPEVLLGENSSERSDIYQIGLLIIYLLSSNPPDSKKGLSLAIENLAGKKALSQTDSRIPKYLDDIILRCTEKDPLMRFSSVKELGTCLRSKSVQDRKSGFMDMLEINYSSADEPEIKKEEPPKTHKETQTPVIDVFPEEMVREKGDKINLIKWVLFSVWVAVAAGIIYSLINILLLGE
ncbi:MAG: serine/threonine-protein kinase [Candidatus Margulisiibacteriota bacterium]